MTESEDFGLSVAVTAGTSPEAVPSPRPVLGATSVPPSGLGALLATVSSMLVKKPS